MFVCNGGGLCVVVVVVEILGYCEMFSLFVFFLFIDKKEYSELEYIILKLLLS